MSLARRLETDAATPLSPAREQRPAPAGVAADNISPLRRPQSEPRILPPGPVAPVRSPAVAPQPAKEQKRANESHSVAIGLIDEVSSIIPLLVDENETLRTVLRRERERLEADVERATLVACEWRKSAESAKQQVEALERKVAEMTEWLERAEARVASEKELALKSARDAAEAECLSSLFEEKLLSSFGSGSPFQATLDRIRHRADADFED